VDRFGAIERVLSRGRVRRAVRRPPRPLDSPTRLLVRDLGRAPQLGSGDHHVLGDRYPGLACGERSTNPRARSSYQFRIEPIDDRVDEHPFVPVVVAQDHSDAFAKLKLLFPDASRAAAEATKIPFVRRTELKSSQM
jgi:hypothetical protein